MRGADRKRKSHVFLSDNEIKNKSRYWFPIPFYFSVCLPQSLVLDATQHKPFVVDDVFFFLLIITVKIIF
jgi:hypothetical protein